MAKKKYLIAFIIILCTSLAEAHPQIKKDSLNNHLSQFSGKEKVDEYILAIRSVRAQDIIQSFDLYDEAIVLAKKEKYDKGIFTLTEEAALNYTYLELFEKSIDFHLLALSYSNKLNEKSVVWKVYNNIGVIYYFRSDFPKSLKYFLLAEKHIKANLEPAGCGVLFNNIGELYRLNDELDSSIVYHKKAANIFSNVFYPNELANTDILFAETLIKQKKYEEAKVLIANLELLNKDKIIARNLADYEKLKGILSSVENKFDSAIIHMSRALEYSKVSSNRMQTSEIYKAFSSTNEVFGNYKKALEYLLISNHLADSIRNAKSIEKSSLSKIRIEKERLMAEQKALDLESEKSKTELLQLVLAASLLVAVIITFAYFQRKKYLNRLLDKNKELAVANEKFMNFVEQSKDAFRLINSEGIIILWSDANEALTGINKAEVLGSHYLDITNRLMNKAKTNKSIDTIKHKVEKLFEQRFFEPMVIEKEVVTPNGELKIILDTIFPIQSGSEFLIGSISRDITERHNFEKELIIAKEQAEASNRIKSEFLAQMSHEIRTPINTILSFSNLVEEELTGKLPEILAESFSSIHSAGDRITRTIDMILNMSELQTGTYETIKKMLDLGEDIIEPIIQEFELAAIQKGLKLIYYRNNDLGLISADEYSVGQIVHNLVSNGIKFTNKGTVEVSTGINNEGNVFVQVQDTGIGIGKIFHKNLFEPFSQEEQGYTRAFDGNGLGLALVKKYCDINNATIQFESEKGKGSVFTVTFLHSSSNCDVTPVVARDIDSNSSK